ncbi:MAG TPA: hypothetical protein VK550_03670 [Polyangiaceae bacterium]|nr:hypothetical protein [Polyangiaceae bacterium]
MSGDRALGLVLRVIRNPAERARPLARPPDPFFCAASCCQEKREEA